MNHRQRVHNLRKQAKPSLEYLKLMMNTFLLHHFYSDWKSAAATRRIFGDHSGIQDLHNN